MERICCCNKAESGCEKSCPKGISFEPDKCFIAPWDRAINIQMVKAAREKQLRELKGMNR